MRLHRRTWGSGDRVVGLVHGTTTDSRTWHRAAPAITSLGFRVVAVDLRGHGRSPRGYYSPGAMADDLVENLPEQADLLLGHSMGAALLARAAEALRPRRLAYAEPFWDTGAAHHLWDLDACVSLKHMDADEIAAQNPRWSPADVAVEIAARRDWDPRTLAELVEYAMSAPVPPVPATVLLGERTGVRVAPERLRRLGYQIRVIPETGHILHHDNLPELIAALKPALLNWA